MFLEDNSYKWVLKDSDDNTLLTVDNFTDGQLESSTTTATTRTLVWTSGHNTLVDNQSLGYVPVDAAVTLPSGASGSQAKARVGSAASKDLTIKKNGSSVGTVTFATTTDGVFTVSSTTAFSTGDTIEIVGPTTADTTLRYVGVALQFTV